MPNMIINESASWVSTIPTPIGVERAAAPRGFMSIPSYGTNGQCSLDANCSRYACPYARGFSRHACNKATSSPRMALRPRASPINAE